MRIGGRVVPLYINYDIFPAVFKKIGGHEIGIGTDDVFGNRSTVTVPAIPAHWSFK